MDTELDDPDEAARPAGGRAGLPAERKNFAGDCVFFLQRHFVDCMLSGQEFESSGHDYLNNVRIVDAAYESARTHNSVRVSAGAGGAPDSLGALGLSDGKGRTGE